MNKKLSLVVLMISISGVALAVDLEEKKARSRDAVQAFGKTLKGELVSAMKAGGPINAVGVCNITAPAIAHSVSVEKRLTISRTSLKTRNMANAPSEWQQSILNDFESKKSAGDAIDTLEYAEVVDTDSGQEFRYMKAIGTADVCLKCHGDSLPEDLTAKITHLYPNDMATNFSKGDIRGAFVVVEKLN